MPTQLLLLEIERFIEISGIIAPQAQLEESANDRSKPEEPISRVLMSTQGSEFGSVFDRFIEGSRRFRGPNWVLGQCSDQPKILCVCVCNFFLLDPFLSSSMKI